MAAIVHAITFLKTYFLQIPPAVRKFFFRSFLLFISWKITYLFFLLPSRIADGPLTQNVGTQTVNLLNSVYHTNNFASIPFVSIKYFEGQIINTNVSRIEYGGQKVMQISDSCNGLELFVLYLGFIIIMPASFIRKFFYSVFGLTFIHLLNILRCFGLAYTQIYFNQYFDFAHHYVFKMVVYSSIFVLWIIFSRKLNFKKLD